jgi:hypothetical protein
MSLTRPETNLPFAHRFPNVTLNESDFAVSGACKRLDKAEALTKPARRKQLVHRERFKPDNSQEESW